MHRGALLCSASWDQVKAGELICEEEKDRKWAAGFVHLAFAVLAVAGGIRRLSVQAATFPACTACTACLLTLLGGLVLPRPRYTLRFPRCHKRRHDKTWKDTATLADIEQLYKVGKGKMWKQDHALEDIDKSNQKKRKVDRGANPFNRPSGVSSKYTLDLDAALFGQSSDMFKGLTFSVRCVDDDARASEVKQLINAHNGVLIAHPDPNGAAVIIIIADSATPRTLQRFRENGFDIITPAWVIACARAGELVLKRPEHVLSASRETEEALSEFADRLGDVFTEETAAQHLAMLLDRNRKEYQPVPGNKTTAHRAELAEIESDLFEVDGSGCVAPLFRGCVFYFDRWSSVADEGADGSKPAAASHGPWVGLARAVNWRHSHGRAGCCFLVLLAWPHARPVQPIGECGKVSRIGLAAPMTDHR